MPDETSNKIKGILLAMKGATASAVVRKDGLMIASTFEGKADEKKLAKLAATMANTADACSSEMGRGAFTQLILEMDNGRLVAMGAGEKAFLLCMARLGDPLGPLLLSMSSSASQIEKILA